MVGHPIANSLQYVLLEDEKRLKSRILFYLFVLLLLLSVNIAAASSPVQPPAWCTRTSMYG